MMATRVDYSTKRSMADTSRKSQFVYHSQSGRGRLVKKSKGIFRYILSHLGNIAD